MTATLLTRAMGLFGRPGPATTEKVPAKVARKPPAAFHAVTVMPGPRCCTPARQVKGKRLLTMLK